MIMTNELLALAQSLLNYMLLLSVQLLLILLVRKKIGRWFGAVIAYRLWLLPLLWLPFHWIDLPTVDWTAVRSLLPAATANLTGTVSWYALIIPEQVLDFEFSALNLPLGGELLASNFWLIVCSLWISISCLLAILQAIRISSFSVQLARLIQPTSSLQYSADELPPIPACYLNGLGSPALYGIFRPMLLLPPDFIQRYDPQQRKLILAHEAVHYRRRDNLWNLLATSVRIVFWFNPLVHLAWSALRLDQEMSCDEIALQKTNPNEGLRYARTLLESVSSTLNVKHQPTLTAWGNLREIKERTQMIKFHTAHKPLFRPGKWLLLLCILAGSLATSVFTNSLQMSFAAEAMPEVVDKKLLSSPVLERIEQVTKLFDQDNYATANAVLDEIKAMNDVGTLSPREQQTMWMFYASLASKQNNYQDAISYNQKILEMKDLPAELKVQTLNQLASLYYIVEDYASSINYYKKIMETGESNKANTALRIAYSYYQLGQFEEAAPYTEQAIELGDRNQNTYRLLRAIYLTTENYTAAIDIVKKSIDLFDDPQDRQLLAQLEQMQNPASAPEIKAPPSADRESTAYLPTTVVPPTYPKRGLQRGIEGWAQVSFTVTETGDVVNPVIVDSSPEKIFDSSSLDAVSKFKFAPRLENGFAIATNGVQYVFRYNLTDD